MTTYRHVTAMLPEAIAYLNCVPGGVYVDGTLGGAGHAEAICRAIMPDGLLIGIDQDQDAIANAKDRLQPFASVVRLFHGNFVRLPEFLNQLKIDAVNGILLDLGLSQHQLESSRRGFSFQKDEPLDMRMDMGIDTCARDLVNALKEGELMRLFFEYGEERWAKRIARAVVAERRREPIRTSRQLAEVVSAAVPRASAAKQKIHPATRVFMALRIAVNGELDRLKTFLAFAPDLLRTGGRLVVLSFHSLEDRMVKHHFRELARGCRCPADFPQCMCGGKPVVQVLTRKVMRPSAEEIERNPMARSTRLRAVEKLAASGVA
jgi:16S rRNA (cytosine1402-N4)-methyltransferase